MNDLPAGSGFPLQAFDPREEFAVVQRRLPHWSQAGTVCFITLRTWDSMPVHVVENWLAERADWLRRHGIDPARPDWETLLRELPRTIIHEFADFVSDRWNEHLDALHGTCVLRQPQLASIVADSLRRFDGDRYILGDFVIMPNHVHTLAAFPDEATQLAQCESWKHFTAVEINRVLHRRGRFWQQDEFDHLVRSTEQFEYLCDYIAKNPSRARLRPGEYIHETLAARKASRGAR
jgi:putative transposase